MILPSLLVFPLGGWPDWSPTARVQRGSSETARCASTGDQQATLSPLPAQSPPMPILFQQHIRFPWSPAPSGVEVNEFLAGQQRVIETPSRFGEILADEESLIADHYVAEQRLVGFGELAKGLFIVELQRMVAQSERPPRTLHGKTEREPFTGLERDQQHVRRNTAGIERPKHLGGDLTKGHRNLGQFTRKAFARPEIEGHALPSPIVNLRFQSDIRLRGRILRDPMFLTIAMNRLSSDLPGSVLAKDNILKRDRRNGMEHFE